MGIQRDNGYSASVIAFLCVGELNIPVAKTGRDTLALAEPCELPPGTEGKLVCSIDGHRESRAIDLIDGNSRGRRIASYTENVPF